MSHTRRFSRVAGVVGVVGLVAMTVATFDTFRAGAITDDESTFEPITPCRLFDTRPSSQVGPRGTRLGPDDEYDLQVTGAEGECVIPDGATAVSINLTAVGATAQTFLSMYPADTDNPGTAVLNVAAGATPTPNKIDVKLSSSGGLTLFNRFGEVDVVGDVMGFYRRDSLAALEDRVAKLEAAQPFAASTTKDSTSLPIDDDTVVTSVTLAVPVDGQVVVTSTASLVLADADNRIRCSITTQPSIDDGHLQTWASPNAFVGEAQLAGVRTFDVAAGASITPLLVCDSEAAVDVFDATLAAIFTPAP